MGAIDRKSWTERWGAKRALHRPSIVESMPKADTTYSSALGPFCQAKSFFAVGQPTITSRISLLFAACRPAAIFWRVWAIVVDAFDCFSWRWFAHVRQEILESSPTCAYEYSSTAVACPTFVASIRATGQHSLPATIRFRWFSVFPMAVRGLALCGRFCRKTAAGFRPTSAQFTRSNERRFSPTRARTFPVGVSAFPDVRKSHYLPPIKNLSKQVDSSTTGHRHVSLHNRFIGLGSCGGSNAARLAYFTEAGQWGK